MERKVFLTLAWTGFTSLLLAQMTLIPLDKPWFFRQAGESTWLNATVPGTVHTDLMACGRIPDPFVRTQEREVQWVDKVDWEYKTSFQRDILPREAEKVILELDGLDTYAVVYLNGQEILSADNFFRAWSVDISGQLREGENNLRIYFHSPVRRGEELLEAQGFSLPAVNDQSENGGLEDRKVSVFLRKPGYHFGWDWGPRLVTSGIYRPVRLRAFSGARQLDLHIRQLSLDDTLARLDCAGTVEVLQRGTYTLEVWEGGHRKGFVSASLEPGEHILRVPFDLPNPRRWWTHDTGQPWLYTFEVRLLSGDSLLDQKAVRKGLRTLRLVQQPDERGASFYFELNGRPLFAKGANYIPSDASLPRVSPEKYGRIIRSAAEANINMLRVWGGGTYEEDLFYELCDKFGILVWQDFMFACSMYPGDADFLRRVGEEATYNIRRLRNHACLALWCGNNEIDVAWAEFSEFKGWGWKQRYGKEKREIIWKAYETVFHEILPGLVAGLDPDTPYWPSSPYYKDGAHASRDSPAGDIHYWGVWHEQHPFEDFYRYRGRFMSEYGFQSFPEFRTVTSYALPEDLEITSAVMMAHQRSGIGNLRIKKYMEDYYRVPKDFGHFLYVGQLLQAEGIRMAIEAHRSAMPFTMGSLYWQLNDCWPVASWSGMDYYLRWKAMHFFVRDAFAPLLLSVRQDRKEVQVNVVSDAIETQGLTLQLRLMDFSGKILHSRELPFTTPSNSSLELVRTSLQELLPRGIGSDQVLWDLRALDKQGKVVARDQHFFIPVKELSLPANPGLSVDYQVNGSVHVIRLRAAKLIKNLYLNFPNHEGTFSNNFMDLIPGEEWVVYFTPQSGMTPGPRREDLVTLSLVDTLKTAPK